MSQFQILGRRPFPFKAIPIRFAYTNFPDTIPTVMLTYGEGYYTFGDMFKTGIIPSIVLVLLMAAWMPFIVGVLGI